MLLHHHRVHSFRVPEGQKTKATRTASSAVSHDSALLNITELRKVVPKRFYASVRPDNDPLPSTEYIRSVVSQFRPPMNIFLTDDISLNRNPCTSKYNCQRPTKKNKVRSTNVRARVSALAMELVVLSCYSRIRLNAGLSGAHAFHWRDVGCRGCTVTAKCPIFQSQRASPPGLHEL